MRHGRRDCWRWVSRSRARETGRAVVKEFVEEARGIGLHQLAHLTNTEIDRWRAEKFFAETNAEVDDRNVERPAGLIDELRDRLIELQGERGQKAEQR